MAQTKTLLSKIGKISGLTICIIIAVVLVFLIGLNIFKYPFYSDYFSSLTKEGVNPGLNEGLVPQGITFFDNKFVTAGYMTDNSSSRIYSVDYETKEIKFFPLTSDGEAFLGHTGGLQYSNGFLYIANEGNSLYKIPSALLNQESGTTIEIGKPFSVNSNTSFISGNDNFLYTGEFHKENEYECSNKIEYNGKTNYAIVEKYVAGDFSKPLAVYSIPAQIQGFCIKDDGTIILSSSWGLTSSKFFIYEPKDIIQTEQEYNGCELFFLDKPSRTITAPAMSEDLDIFVSKDGKEKVITMFESSSNKYFFGKLFFSNYIAGFDF